MKHPSYGSTLSVDLQGGTSFTKIGQVMDLAGPNITRGDVDVTDHDNATVNGGDGYREYLGGVPDGGDVTFNLHFDAVNDDTHGQTAGTGILNDFTRDTLANWQLSLNTLSGSMDWTFLGYLNGFSPEAPVEGAHTAEVTVKVSGKPTLAAG